MLIECAEIDFFGVSQPLWSLKWQEAIRVLLGTVFKIYESVNRCDSLKIKGMGKVISLISYKLIRLEEKVNDLIFWDWSFGNNSNKTIDDRLVRDDDK